MNREGDPGGFMKWVDREGVFDKDRRNAEENGLDPREERRRIRLLAPEAELDLHGCSCAQAQARLDAFFRYALERDLVKVLIIHGKGRHSKERAVLGPWVKAYIERHDFCGESGPSPEHLGGRGATWVILKNRFSVRGR